MGIVEGGVVPGVGDVLSPQPLSASANTFWKTAGHQPMPGGSSVPSRIACRLTYTQLIFSWRERLVIFKKPE